MIKKVGIISCITLGLLISHMAPAFSMQHGHEHRGCCAKIGRFVKYVVCGLLGGGATGAVAGMLLSPKEGNGYYVIPGAIAGFALGASAWAVRACFCGREHRAAGHHGQPRIRHSQEDFHALAHDVLNEHEE
jgi:hypothetical protein